MFKLISRPHYLKLYKNKYRFLPNNVDIYLVLHGQSDGCVFQDVEGELLVIRGVNTPFVIYTGKINYEKIQFIGNILANYDYCAFTIVHSSLEFQVVDYMASLGYEYINRYRFASISDLQNVIRTRIISDFELTVIDNAEKFVNCAQYKYLLELYGSVENYLKYCYALGVVDRQTEKIVSETHAFLGDRIAEPSVTTLETYRGMGLSFIANQQLIIDLQQRNYTLEWSCDSNNSGSIAIAQKLGLQRKNDYVMFWRDSRKHK